MTDEIVYSASEVYKRLGISDSTLRKYMEVLQREGFAVKKDNRGRRQYTDSDIMVIEKLIEFSKHDGMTVWRYDAREGSEDDCAANRES